AESEPAEWAVYDLSGPQGIKFDLVQLIDLDRDGDLDVLTCEERDAGRGLGVIWYENPSQEPVAPARLEESRQNR
ncbi:MAG: hypothetical protein JXR94_16420, partial [Candidatus Hydrogenedentes bacterium]|nr:hypothetical protein [Candidatus Hydrogenedentota bacterium]